MYADLSEEHRSLQAAVADFAREVVAPVAAHHDATATFPYDVVRQMGEMGLFGLPFPERYGGMGGDYLAFCLTLEELARVDSSVAITLEAAVGLGAMPVFRFGTEAQREEWLPELTAGRALGAFGLTEPDGGSDAGALRTSARLDGGAWVINGTKAFITNSGTDLTRLVTVAAVTGEQGSRREISSLLVPVPRAGFQAGPGYSKVGWHASDTRELAFVDCAVPEENLLGERGRGYANFLSILDEGRIAIAALSVGLAQGCLDECLRYVGERRAFGRPLGGHQVIAFKVADMEVRAHVARLAYYEAAARLLDGRPFKRQAAIAKLVASDAAVTNAREATQIFGGYGFINDFPVARHWRDSKVLEIGEGTSEVQRWLIARDLGVPGQ
ncbi:MAG: acyl-CoA dehydrogenase family protein [Mycobacteriales bacterium]